MNQERKTEGFSLIELLIAISIIGILASFAYPSYVDYMQQARRAQAQQIVLEIADREEMYLLDARAYTDSFTSLNFSASDWTCVAATCSNSYYIVGDQVNGVGVTVDNSATPPTYTVTATAQGSQAADGDLTYSSAGVKTRTISGVDQGW
jgi:type IV pilus assembly protein PilE